MVSPFEIAILKLKELGAFQFLFPFILTSAIFYGLLRKSQLFGPPERNVAVNGVIALITAFMVWAYPILAGVNLETQLATFMFNGVIAILIIMVGLMVVGMFLPPDLPAKLGEKIGSRALSGILIFGIIVGIAVFLSSGLISAFLPGFAIEAIPTDTLLAIAVLIIIVATIVILAIPWGKGKE
jgi:uncharacterized membrane protein YjfL (UPF0719 family)